MIWKLFAKKIVKVAVQATLSWVGAERLASAGVTVDTEMLVAYTYVALESLRQILKHKFGMKFL